ncbi:MAG: hypothetical protein JNJ58_03755 [Chitinophagaceae bacterium]|nr:hypothetical protein [Chitinophagaceae bacterium]
MEPKTTLSEASSAAIKASTQWAKYAGVLTIVNLGLSFLQLILGFFKSNPGLFGSMISFLLSAVISLVMAINLLNYAKHARYGIQNGNSTSLYQALYHLKVYFTVMGVLFLIALGLMLLGILIGLITMITQL